MILVGPPAPDSRPEGYESLPPEVQNGDPEQFGFSLEAIVIEGHGPISLISPGVTAIVGGNNAGKSTLLRQINTALPRNLPGPPRLLTEVKVTKSGSVADLAAWLMQHANLVASGPGRGPMFARPGGQQVKPTLLAHYWGGAELGELASSLVHYANARTRHEWTAGAPRRNNFTDPPAHPIHSFEYDEERRSEISALSKRAFDAPLTVDRLSGQVFFRVGVPDCDAPPIDNPTADYQAAVAAMPPLADQGDGMVFMLGALIPIIAANFPVILLDEPEAFLHPPQAHLMGQALADLAAKRRLQILVATHDRNILRGLLSETAADVSILRLSRTGDEVRPRVLSVPQVRKISSDKVLRHTNILDGLFHRLVVLAENERDCRFYEAALHHLGSREAIPTSPHDVLFIPTNGKGNMAGIAEILKDTGVRIVASPDLDLLNNSTVLKRLVKSLGGAWDSQLEQLYIKATRQFRVTVQRRLNKDVRISIEGVLKEDPDGFFGTSQADRIREAMRVDNPWNALKQQGKVAMSAERDARNELLRRLDVTGVVLVEVGELENFDADASRASKDTWLRDALDNEAHETEVVAKHIRRLLRPSAKEAETGQVAAP